MRRTARPSRRTTTAPTVDAGYDFDAGVARSMLDELPVNVLFADPSGIIRYLNQRSRATLQTIQNVLPVPPHEVLGSPIDVFHRAPDHQRSLLADQGNLPHHVTVELGPEWMEIDVSAVRGADGQLAGYLMRWDVITGRMVAADRVVGHTTAVAAAIDEMNASIADVARGAAITAEVTQTAVDAATRAAELVSDLAEESRAIEEVLGLIASVASQTKLLALNATIEAAHAGEHGKGFGVVADEVKNLANSAADSTAEITNRIGSLRDRTDDIHRLIDGMATSIQSARDSAAIIANTVQQQATAASEINDNATQAAREVEAFVA